MIEQKRRGVVASQLHCGDAHGRIGVLHGSSLK
jgi:hypothetical protein